MMRKAIHEAFKDVRRGPRYISEYLGRPRRLRPPQMLLCLPMFAAFLFTGCPQKPVKPAFTQIGAILPPHVARREVDATPPAIDTETVAEWPTIVLSIPSPRPPAPRRSATATEPEVEPTKPEAPQISPQLSSDEKERAQSAAAADIRSAQQNLDAAGKRRLSAMQQDLAEKIRSFVKQAQDAMAAADWQRAQSLAHKAQLLSVEFARSF